ncbi:hypothetical protein HIM_03558 [Hirsutella minnesotensis 3608]|uniref:Zn(2)-C6 fungal-type domain-containing protein n=1 Tax=Hirsutella minnesotensis 3608 TaxID=1043627 RepID=A0A0F8A2S6_9HYPO|nr:hypothetical protein HIM_03558 [Hirsutella minnesotensis 3608]
MTQAVKRACDACHRRKVKCDGINPCRNCSSAQLSCTYNAIPQKKGPKGSRAKVISELRETQRQTSLSAKVQNRMNGIACPPPSSGPTPGLLTSELVKECAHFYFDNLYAQAPVLDRHQIEQQVLYMEQNRDAYCMMTSLCAFIMLQPGMSMPPGDPYNLDMVPGANIISSQLLLEEALRVRRGYEYLDSITLNALVTSFFIFGCYYGQEMHDKAWFHLREATTMIHMAGMHKEEYYLQFDAAEAARRRRLYWLFFVLERAYALQRQRPVSLQATINLPTIGDDPNDVQAHQLNSFISLVNLYRPFDDAFTSVWTKTKSHLSSQYLNNMQKQLNELVQSYACQDGSFSDIHTNQQWLKNTSWQLTSGSANSGGEDLSFQYPIHLAREMAVNMASQFPVQIDLLGPSLIEKLIEMTSSMTEYLSMQAPSRDPFSMGPRDHLSQMISIIAVSRNGDHRFLPLLMNKLHEVLPRIANPMLQNPPENASMGSVDIFDGFGNAGMAQPPSQLHLSIGTDFDRKFSVEEYEKKYNVEVNGHTPESLVTSSNHSGSPTSLPQQTADIGGSFSGSPGIVSPGVDYSHAMNSFGCSSMPDMVMHTMGNSAQNNLLSAPQGHQHVQHVSPAQDNGVGHHNGVSPQSIRSQGINHSLNTPHQMNYRTSAQHSDAYRMHPPPQLQHMTDFNTLPRGTSGSEGSLLGVNPISGELDFNAPLR